MDTYSSNIDKSDCRSYKVATYILLVLLVISLSGVLVVLIQLKNKVRELRRKEGGKRKKVIRIGRNKGSIMKRKRKLSSSLYNNNTNHLNLQALHDHKQCPVQIPAINIIQDIANFDDTTATSTQDPTYARICQPRRGIKPAADSAVPVYRDSLKSGFPNPSGDYADFAQDMKMRNENFLNANIPEIRPLVSSTPACPTAARFVQNYHLSEKSAYVNPANFRHRGGEPSINEVNTSNVFIEDRQGLKFSLASAIRSVPGKISSRFSFGGNPSGLQTPANTPLEDCSKQNATYLSFSEKNKAHV